MGPETVFIHRVLDAHQFERLLSYASISSHVQFLCHSMYAWYVHTKDYEVEALEFMGLRV